MKGNSYLGYKILIIVTLVIAIANAFARDYRVPFYDPKDPPPPDTPTQSKLHFPLTEHTGEPNTDNQPSGFDLKDPANIKKEVEYDPESNRYYLTERIGNEYYRSPTYLTMREYLKYQAAQDEQNYWIRRRNALSLFSGKPKLPNMTKEGVFDRIFGGSGIQVRPQGNVDITFGGNWQNIKNPTLVQSAQKYGVFDFDMQMNINLVATIGDKMKLNISNNSKPTFAFQDMQKLEYTGKEDEILKKLELGNVSFPLKTSLITGVQSLFGIKTQLQFGKLWITSVVSQQKSQRKTTTVQGGGQTQQISIKADEYEENRHFLLAHAFRENYNKALQNFPVINSLYTINKIEVWVTNRTGSVDGVRDMMAFMDLGEKNPYRTSLTNGAGSQFPDNRSNTLYDQLTLNPNGRTQSQTEGNARSLGLTQSLDWEHITVRKLNTSEFTMNPQLGYISVNYTMNPDDVLGVAYRYTYNGKVYQVGEFAEDLPPDTSNAKVIYLKLLKGTSSRPTLPIWQLMMKNVYPLGGYGVSNQDFRLNVLYQDPGGGEKRYLPLPAGNTNAGIPLLQLLNLDRLNSQNDPTPDGLFDYVEGVTINSSQGKIMFPVLEPFGADMAKIVGNDPIVQKQYVYSKLYDSTKTIARQFQQNNRYVLKGTFKSSTTSEIALGGFNIPQGSVTVTAGGQQLVENADYTIDYGLGRVKILNTGLLSSGIPINIVYEDNATFGFKTQNFMASRFDYYVNPKLTIGSTVMRLSEQPFTQKTTYGDDPIKNTVLGMDANYQSESPGLTRLIDKLPVYSTTAPSFISTSGEVAALLPGHANNINSLDPEGAVYIDDFEGAKSSYDLRFPAISWSLASTPFGALNANGNELFPEASDDKTLAYNYKRAKLAWYQIEPTLVDPSGSIPDYVKKEPLQHYIRLVQQADVYPAKSTTTLQNVLTTFDLGYYPSERGPYNFDTHNVDPGTGRFTDPQARWGGIMRSIDYTDFESSNVEFIQFWVLDPFINDPNNSGSVYINLGNVSEDVLKDNIKAFENGITYPKDLTKLTRSQWGLQPTFQQQITRSFDNDPNARSTQDVGFDGLDDEEEKTKFAPFLTSISNIVTNPAVLQRLNTDPASDNYHYFRGGDYDAANLGVLQRYKDYNGPHGNSPISDINSSYSSSATTIPESEDINKDNTLNTSENYYQYRIDLHPNMNVGESFVINKQVTAQAVKLPDGTSERETWYQIKIPIRSFTNKVGTISDFRSIRFIRMFLNGFKDSVYLRFASLELGRNQWRQYQYSLQSPGENIPQPDLLTTNVAVTTVSLEENASRSPVNYVIPPGVNRQLSQVTSGQSIQQNEQALSLQVCELKDGDARAVYKEVGLDMRQFKNLKMFIHGESQVGKSPLKNGDLKAFIRVGSDFINNYYEYQIPLTITLPNSSSQDYEVWPTANNLDISLNDLVNAKTQRNNATNDHLTPYSVTDAKGNTIVVVGDPNTGTAKTIMMGVLNPKKTTTTPGDDGAPKCVEIWFNELRVTGINEKAGYAATGKLNVQLADLGTVRLSGSMHTQGYGNIDQKINDRLQDDYYQYDMSTNLNVGKLMPKKWGVQLPFYMGYTESVSTPKYNPYDLDILLKDQLAAARDAKQRDSIKNISQDYTSITSVNLTNVRITGDPQKQSAVKMPWSAKNFDLSYSYNKQNSHNPTIDHDDITTQKLEVGYNYNIKTKSVFPFTKLIKSKSRWFSPVKDFNFNLLPSNFAFRTNLNKIYEESQVRNTDPTDDYVIAPTYYKNFTWSRTYATRLDLTKSISFDYNATNNSRIDEPYGKIDTKAKQDTLWNRILSLGRNTYFTQSFNGSYNVPLQKLPITDWTTARATYSSTYSWTAASLLAKSLGNTITNSQSIQLNGELNFTQLYNKNKWLRTVNQPKPPKFNKKKSMLQGGENAPALEGPKGRIRGGGTPGEMAVSNLPGDDNNNAKDNEKKPAEKDTKKVVDKNIIIINGQTLNAKDYSDVQVDSLRKIQKTQEDARLKAEKEKEKKARIAERKAKKNKIPEISDPMRAVGRMLTMVKRVTLNYAQNAGTTLPGYMDSTKMMGINTLNGEPGFGFVYGYQPNMAWLQTLADNGKLSTDSLFNSLFMQTYSRNYTINATVEPIKDFRIDLSLTQSFSKSHTELFKDSTANNTGSFQHLNPYETGSFNISFIGLATMFKGGGANSTTYKNFLSYREVISQRLGNNNPYNNNTADPNNPAYKKGYTQYSQDVLIPSFLAAYSGKSPNTVALIDPNNSGIRSNPFKYYFPMPNWRVTYNGLSKLAALTPIFNNLALTHAYSGTMSMNSFVSTLFYQDIYAIGYPSFIDSNSGNFVPFYTVPNVTISEQLSPLLGVEAAFKNNMTASIRFNKSRTVSLSLTDYQVSETNSQEVTLGFGYRVHGLNLPFSIMGVTRLKNDLNFKVDLGLRDDKTSNSYLAQNLEVVSRGQKVITISPSADYIVNDKLTLRFYYDRRQTIPYTTQSYPITTAKGGVMLRFIFGQ